MLDFQLEGLFSMRFAKEFKLECVRKHKAGKTHRIQKVFEDHIFCRAKKLLLFY